MKINREKKCHKCIADLIIMIKHMQVRKGFQVKEIQIKIDVTNVVTPNMWRDLDVQPVDINAGIATSLVIFIAYATRRINMKGPWSQDHPRYIN